jgi:peptidyl-prolyl cis-trans isomerase SurA
MFENGVFEKGSPKLPLNYTFTKGLSEVISNDNYFYVINGKNFLPAEPKAFSEVKGKVISDYQQYLESNWIQQLKEEFKVEVNQSEFERIKQQL